MSNNKSGNLMIPPRGGTFNQLVSRVKLIWRLLADRRVNTFLKILPIASLAYLVMPIDIMPDIALPVIGVLDDAAILWLGSYLFVELCPPEVVQEHQKALMSNATAAKDDEFVDGEATEMNEEKK